MIVEFVGGSLAGQYRNLDRFYPYINNYDDVYAMKAVFYKQLGWTYVWYEFYGNNLYNEVMS